MKLYKVNTSDYSSYVVADSMDRAAKAFESWLEMKKYGFGVRVISVTEVANTDVSPRCNDSQKVDLVILDCPTPFNDELMRLR